MAKRKKICGFFSKHTQIHTEITLPHKPFEDGEGSRLTEGPPPLQIQLDENISRAPAASPAPGVPAVHVGQMGGEPGGQRRRLEGGGTWEISNINTRERSRLVLFLTNFSFLHSEIRFVFFFRFSRHFPRNWGIWSFSLFPPLW